jgi:CubicO group peptidase (beta-lactamase class C family)
MARTSRAVPTISHRAGLPTVEGAFTLAEVLEWDPIVRALEQQAPLWRPRSRHGYHLRTFGWLVGEVFHRASGRTVGSYFNDEIAGPRGLDWYLGLPEELESRVAWLVPAPEVFHRSMAALPPQHLLLRAMTTPSKVFRYDNMFNERRLRACELPSSNSMATASGVAKLYASLLGWGDGPPILGRATVEKAALPLARGFDCVLRRETGFSSGYEVKPSLPEIVGD